MSSTDTQIFRSFSDLLSQCDSLEASNDIITCKSLEITFLPYLKSDFSPFDKNSDNEGNNRKKALTEKEISYFKDYRDPLVSWNNRYIDILTFIRKIKSTLSKVEILYRQAHNICFNQKKRALEL